MLQYFVVLTFCVCDSRPSRRTGKTILDEVRGTTLTVNSVLLWNTTETLPLREDARVTGQTIGTSVTTPGYTEKFAREPKVSASRSLVSLKDTTRAYSPSIIETSSLSTLKDTNAGIRVEGPTKLKHDIDEEGNARTLTTRAGTAVLNGDEIVHECHQISYSGAGTLVVKADGVNPSPVHNSTVKSFLCGTDTGILNAGLLRPMRRQGNPENIHDKPEGGGMYNKQHADKLAANRFTTVIGTTVILTRTPPYRENFKEQCDYIAQYCLRVYQTGRVCGRTIYHHYLSFKNYCMLDYVNCMERYEMWQLIHMGQCYNLKTITEYIHYGYHEDYFLDRDYVADDQQWGLIG